MSLDLVTLALAKKYVDDAVANIDIPEAEGFVSYDKAQNLTTEQKAQARENISKYTWRTGKYFGMVSFRYADINNSVNWEIAESMPDANGYRNTTIVDSMAFICKSIFEGGIGLDFTAEVNAIVNNLNVLKEAGGVNGDILFGFPDEEDFLGYAINIATGYSDGRVIINIYKNFMSDSVKTGSWVHYPDGTVTTNISVRNIDATLTKQGVYADAKAVGDALANIEIPEVEGAVSYVEAQNLTADEKTQARKNIQKYDWRDGVFSNVIKFKYCDMLESINWDVAASMPDALGYNNNIVDYMAQMTKLLFESLPTANNDTMVNNIVTNYKALRDAGGLSNTSVTFGYPDNDDNLGFSIQMYAASNDANKITIKIYDNNIHSNVKTGYWIANSDGTVTKSISTINLDTTLTKQGYYADAKAVGDRLAALEARIAALEGNAQQS